MKLKDYIAANKLTQRDFSRRLGRSEASVSRIVNKVVRPDWDTMDLIYDETGGQVTPNDFMDASPAKRRA